MSGSLSEAEAARERETENACTYKSLDRILHQTRGGFYFLIASPRTQAAALARYADANLAVYDFAKAPDEGEGRHIIQLLRLTQREPDRDVYVYQNFQLALWDSGARDGLGDWDVEAMHRLNYSRDQLNHLRRRMVFCLTREADEQLNRHAMDFYDFVRLFLRLEDEPEERPAVEKVRPVDRSVGVNVKVDFSQDEEALLNQAIALGHQAKELYEAGRYGDALYLYEKQLEIHKKIQKKEDLNTSALYSGLSAVYRALSDYKQALDYNQKSLVIAEKAQGNNYAIIAACYNDFGVIYDDLGKYDRALKYYRKALKIRESILGENHPDTAKIYNNLGVTYYNTGDYNIALKYAERAMAVRENVLGVTHPDTAMTYDNLGILYDASGDYARALYCYQKALNIFENVLGANHPDTATLYNNLGVTYEHMGDYSRALQLYHNSLTIREKKLGRNHPYIITTYHNIANTYEAMGNTAAAAEWRKKAEDAQRERDAQQNGPGPSPD